MKNIKQLRAEFDANDTKARKHYMAALYLCNDLLAQQFERVKAEINTGAQTDGRNR